MNNPFYTQLCWHTGEILDFSFPYQNVQISVFIWSFDFLNYGSEIIYKNMLKLCIF